MNYNCINFKVKEVEFIEKELRAFCNNFDKGITLEKWQGMRKNDYCFYIYVGVIDKIKWEHEYIYRVDTIEELKGWLYGMVQANNGYLKKFSSEV